MSDEKKNKIFIEWTHTQKLYSIWKQWKLKMILEKEGGIIQVKW